jgi:hypothetical protein
MRPATERPLHALNRVLESIQSVRNGRALYVLLCSFSLAGLLLAMAQSALLKDATLWGVLQGGLALTVAFYGGNAAGLLVMDEARGRAPREVAQAVRDALAGAHRLLLVLLGTGVLGLTLIGVLIGLLWLCRLPSVGPLLFGLVVPVGVVALGLTLLAAVAVVGPLAAPATWRGLGVRDTWAFLRRQIRQRLLFAALLSAAVSLLAGAVGVLVSFAVIMGGRAVSALAVLVVHVDLPPQQLMGGLFGYGLRTLGAAGAPAAQNAYGMAALIGGGVVFALALVLPGVVYLRGMCSAYLALEEADALHGLQAAPND